MKSIRVFLAPIFFLIIPCVSVTASKPAAGFTLPDSVNEMTLKFRTVKGLIVLPVTINDSVQVNLILDTGCRNIILFGRKFKKKLRMNTERPIQFSGLGRGQPLTGTLSIGNKVSINQVLGEQIPVVVVGSNSIFSHYHNIHGVIGYDIFVKFEIELDVSSRTITFRQALKSSPPSGYFHVPLRIVDARPVMTSQVVVNNNITKDFDLMIDTGSSLGLLLKTTNISAFHQLRDEKVLGIGFNGPVSGYHTVSERLILRDLEIEQVPTGIVSSPWHNNASIGMDILKHYTVILNYCKAYVCFKANA